MYSALKPGTNSLSSHENPTRSALLPCFTDEHPEREVARLALETHLARAESGLVLRPPGPRVHTPNLKPILPLQDFNILNYLGLNWFP